jgi:hypothetical protein
MRAALVGLVALAACAGRAPEIHLPAPEPGALRVRAAAASGLGSVQPIAVAVTNGRPRPVRIDPRQVFALAATGERVPPLPPGDAARHAGGRVPGALKGGAVGAATGGALGALGGVIAGAIQGGIGMAAAIGSAVGAGVGAVTGAIGGARDGGGERVAAFQERALPASALATGMSATGYVYYPAGTYREVELITVEEGSGSVVRAAAAIE